jgi:hypothetical protein
LVANNGLAHNGWAKNGHLVAQVEKDSLPSKVLKAAQVQGKWSNENARFGCFSAARRWQA